jgi:FKBP-type peptidyl-prolyl cis-trans isomerase
MKQIKLFLSLAVVAALMLSSCKYTYNAGDRLANETNAKVDSISYAFGMYLGNSLKSSNVGEINFANIQKGISDVLTGEKTMFKEQEVMTYIQNYLMERQVFVSEKKLEEGKNYLASNKTKEGVVETPSGLQYKIVKEGEGIAPQPQDTITVKYSGAFTDGKVFESNLDQKDGIKVPLMRMIKGWQEGLLFAKEGGEIELTIPSSLAYGPNPVGPIPGNSVLVFTIQLIKIDKGPAPEQPAESLKK